ncbi:MAG: hypothetical protein CTY36_00320 [Methylocystis sp.]|nr:MAG: hypothetical protein CTY36_00320 [Methylocystis sp.]
MSYQVTAWAVGRKTGSSSGKALLLAIANYAQANGETYQPISRLAEDTEQSQDSVRRRLVEFEDMGLIARCGRWAESGRRLSDWIIVLYCDAAYEFARAQGWKGPKERDAAPEAGNEIEDENAAGKDAAAADESACLPSQIARATLANCEGHPSTGARVTLAPVRGLYKENSNRTVRDSLSPTSEADGCAVREREIVYEKTTPLSDDELEDWKKFHERWIWHEKESAIVARGVFRSLSREDRALALRYVRDYHAERKGKGVAYAGNWLKARGWEEFVEREAAAAAAKAKRHAFEREKYGGVLIWRGTQQSAAWAKHDDAPLKFSRIGPFDNVVVKPSEWPPSTSHADAPRDGPTRRAG